MMRTMDKRTVMAQQTAEANVLKMKGEERRPKGRRESKKKEPAQEKQRSGHSSGRTGQSLNACLMSTLAMKGIGPN